jgi:membrane protease YdiL (CAAX protease family)
MEALLLIATAIWGGLHWRALAVQFKRFGQHRWEAVVGVAALAPLLGINYLYHDWIRELFEGERLSEQVAEAQIPTAVAIITFCVLPAILEEIAFRGLLQHWLHIAVKPITALLLASALFAALHFSLVSFWYLFLVGMLLGWLRYRTGSLYPAMVVHFLHNLIVLEVF